MDDPHRLNQYCRICGSKVKRAKSKDPVYSSIKYKEAIQATFGIDVSTDNPAIHPQQHCNPCHSVVQRCYKLSKEGLPFRHSTAVFEWIEHREVECTVSR